jgi:hypothetical protein
MGSRVGKLLLRKINEHQLKKKYYCGVRMEKVECFR